LHPGYGFLSENPALVLQCHSNAIIFIGPSPETLRIAGDKMRSRDLAVSLDVPVAPGVHVASTDDVRRFAQTLAASGTGDGYPVMIKALDGGGGRGIRVVENADKVDEAFKRCVKKSTAPVPYLY
jgi:acetyl/propionyl-CoA carboxylase alpha subunit